jgi:PAS domain S-box-containing protein
LSSGGRIGARWLYLCTPFCPDNGGMERSREPLELLEAFERASDGVFAVDEGMRVVYWNRAAERIFGVDAGAALGRRCDEIVAGSEASGASLCAPDCRVMGCARRGHATETYDLVRMDVSGGKQWLNVTILCCAVVGVLRRSPCTSFAT